MSSKAMSLKGRIKNYAKSNNIAAQVVLQNYMFECFLARLSLSEHRGSTEQIADVKGILNQIEDSNELKEMWDKYRKKFAYASDISYENVMKALHDIFE